MARMESRVDYAARPDFGAHVRRLGEAELRRLLSVACPGAPIPGSPTETAELLMTRDAAHASVSAATPDMLAVVKMIHVLEDSAAVDDLAAVSVWASEADTMPHDGDGPPSTARVPASASDVTDLLGRAGDLGLVWEEPAGVWNVPPHVSEVLMQDPTMATPVDCLLQFNDRDVLLERMANLGLVDEAELEAALDALDNAGSSGAAAAADAAAADDAPESAGTLDDAELLARLRAFMCSPRRVRALVGTAPHYIQKQLLLFAREGIYLDQREWGARRSDAVDWAEEHLLAVRFEVPRPVHTSESTAAGYGGAGDGRDARDAHPELPGQFELDLAVRREKPVRDDIDYNASLLSPVALALKLGRHWIPRPHPEEQRPAIVEQESLGQAATAAVSVATTLMQTWEDGGFLGGPLMDFAGAVAVNDFATAVGADESVVHEVVGMLAAAGFIHPADGQPTARSAQKWFSADASQRWAWLVAGWLQGPDRWIGDDDTADWMPTPEMMATVARRVRRHLVMFAAELEDDMMWYPCCIESRLAWRCGALFDGLEDIWGNLVHRTLQGARVLGLLIDGTGGRPVRAVADAMMPAWFTGQLPTVDETMELVHAEAGDIVAVGRRAQLLTPPSLLLPDRVEVVAMVRGVPERSLAVLLDSVAVREKCGATSLWLFTDESLAEAMEEQGGRWAPVAARIAYAAGDSRGTGGKLAIIRHRLRAITEARDLWELLPDDDAPYDPATEYLERAAAEDDGVPVLFDVSEADDAGGDAVGAGSGDVTGVPAGDETGEGSVGGSVKDAAGENDGDGADGDDADGDGDDAGDGSAEAKDGDAEERGSSAKGGPAPTIEDPYRRPDPGTGPGVPIQPPLF